MKNPAPVNIGSFRGFDMELYFDTTSRDFKINLKGESSHTVVLGDDASGNTLRLDNSLDNFNKELEKTKLQLEDTKQQFENAKIESTKSFPQEQELKEKYARLEEVNKELNISDKEENEIDTDEIDDEERCQEHDFDKNR